MEASSSGGAALAAASSGDSAAAAGGPLAAKRKDVGAAGKALSFSARKAAAAAGRGGAAAAGGPSGKPSSSSSSKRKGGTTAARVAVGTKIYVPDAAVVWKTAEVVSAEEDGSSITARIDEDNELVTLHGQETWYLCNTDVWNSTGLSAPNDLTMLTHLHEAAVLDSLHLRFDIDEIYTFTGPILIAVNPFKQIQGLYDMHSLSRYGCGPDSETQRRERSQQQQQLGDSTTAAASAAAAATGGGGGGSLPAAAASSPSSAAAAASSSSDPTTPTAAAARVPHVFATSQAAYEGLSKTKRNQTILISGESGAGKTESTKFVMKHLACAGSAERLQQQRQQQRQQQLQQQQQQQQQQASSQVEAQVLESNPLLEAFGNARTLRNDNSSRFGKFIELQFETPKTKGVGRGTLCGARIQTYLLEKVRVCDQQEGERNFHIFYQLCAAAEAAAEFGGIYDFPSASFLASLNADPAAADPTAAAGAGGDAAAATAAADPAAAAAAAGARPQQLDLGIFEPRDRFRFLTKSSCYQLQGVDDCAAFDATLFAMQTVGIQQQEQMDIFSVVGAVLCLGNLCFEPPRGSSSSESSCLSDSCAEYVTKACLLLGVPTEALEEALCYRTIKTVGESYRKPLKTEEATEMRDALCRALYGCLFLQVVARTNESIGYLCEAPHSSSSSKDGNSSGSSRKDSSSSGSTGGGRGRGKEEEMLLLFCGVLDIFGFECFQQNSFEQLCINFTNERLQHFFNTFVFKCEEQLYKAEDIHWNSLDFPDNQDCVQLLQAKPHGLLCMLDEECLVPAGKDRGFNAKITQKFAGHQRFGVIKTKPMSFTIHHFAGSVEYCSEGFLEKNKDQLSLDLQATIKASEKPFVAGLFEKFLTRGGGSSSKAAAAVATGGSSGGRIGGGGSSSSSRFTTVSSEFREQLSALMHAIEETTPHFIRCIKPNPQNLPDVFDRAAVNEQLRYGGVLQAVQVSRAGYPVRLSHRECVEDFLCLLTAAERQQHHLQQQHQIRDGGGRLAAAVGDGGPAAAAGGEVDWRRRAEVLLRCLEEKLHLSASSAACRRAAAAGEEHHEEDGQEAEGEEGGAAAAAATWAVGRTLCFLKNEAYEILSSALMRTRVAAATRIQAKYKAHAQRLLYLQQRGAIVLLQRQLRRFLARLRQQRVRREAATLLLQAAVRGWLQRRRMRRALHAVRCMQALWRGRCARMHFKYFKQHLAASKIQAAWRGRQQQRRYRLLRRATLLAQTRWRSILARRMLRELRHEARQVAGLLKKSQDLQRDLLEAKTKQAEAESHVLQLHAKNEDLAKALRLLQRELELAKNDLTLCKEGSDRMLREVRQMRDALLQRPDKQQQQEKKKQQEKNKEPQEDEEEQQQQADEQELRGERLLLSKKGAAAAAASLTLQTSALSAAAALQKTEEELRGLCMHVEELEQQSRGRQKQQQQLVAQLQQELQATEAALRTALKERSEAETQYKQLLQETAARREEAAATTAAAAQKQQEKTAAAVSAAPAAAAEAFVSPNEAAASPGAAVSPPAAAAAGTAAETPSPAGRGAAAAGEKEGEGREVLAQKLLSLGEAAAAMPFRNAHAVEFDLLVERCIDVMLLGAAGVGKTTLVEELLQRSGDETQLQQLRMLRKLEELSPQQKTPQFYEVTFLQQRGLKGGGEEAAAAAAGGTAPVKSAAASPTSAAASGSSRAAAIAAAAASSSSSSSPSLQQRGGKEEELLLQQRRLLLLDFPGVQHTHQNPVPHIRQSFVVAVIFDPTREETLQHALQLLTCVVLPARPKAERDAFHFRCSLPAGGGCVYLVANRSRCPPPAAAADQRVDGPHAAAACRREELLDAELALAKAAALGLRCEYKEIYELDALLQEVFPLVWGWRASLQQLQHQLMSSNAEGGGGVAAAAVALRQQQQQLAVGWGPGGLASMAATDAHQHSAALLLRKLGTAPSPAAAAGRGGGGTAAAGGGGRPSLLLPSGAAAETGSTSSTFLDSIRAFLARPSFYSAATGRSSSGLTAAAAASLSSSSKYHMHHRPVVELRLLRPSLAAGGILAQKVRERLAADDTAAVSASAAPSTRGNTVVVPVQQLQDSQAAITCVAFGREFEDRDYILLAAASKDGSVVLYRCHRSMIEQQLYDEESLAAAAAVGAGGGAAAAMRAAAGGGDSSISHACRAAAAAAEQQQAGDPAKLAHNLLRGPCVSVHMRLVGHSRAVTCLFFSAWDEHLITTSIDKSIRFWSIKNGEMLKVFTDSAASLAAAILPLNPTIFLTSNSNAVLRVVCATTGRVLQKLKTESEIRALRFDESGLFCFAGTKAGTVNVFEATEVHRIAYKFHTSLGRGAITCLTFVPCNGRGQPPRLLVNCCDSTVAIIECIYGTRLLTNLIVRHRVRIAHTLLPLRCCFSNYGGGWLVSGSEDSDVCCFSLQQGGNFKRFTLTHHQAPVLAVAVNAQNTLLVSADSTGKLVLWRTLEFVESSPTAPQVAGRRY